MFPNNEGVQPTPSGAPGSTGSQQASGVPAPSEAQKAESNSFGTLASGAQEMHGRTKDRFEVLLERLKGAEAEKAQLQQQLLQTQSVPTQPAREGYEEQIAKLREVVSENSDRDPHKAHQALEQIADLRAKAAVNDTLENFMREQSQAQQQQQFIAGVEQSWQNVRREFPEMNDPSSELYQAADQIYAEDPALKQDPNGVYKAAEIAYSRRVRGAERPTAPQLEGSRPSVAPSAEPSLIERKNEVIQKMRQGDLTSLEKFIEGNVKDVLYQDHLKPQ